MSTRKPRREAKIGEKFIALPHSVIRSAAYRGLSHTERSLLIDIAANYNSCNNGKLTASMKYLRPLGWRSVDTVNRAKHVLLESKLLIETRKGARPNKAAWYMIAWRPLDIAEGMDAPPAVYQAMQREFRQAPAAAPRAARPVPSNGVAARAIAPSHGLAH